MHIVHYLSTIRLEAGGVIRAVLDMAAQLAARGHCVTLLTFDPKDVPELWNAGGPGLPSVHKLEGDYTQLAGLNRAFTRQVAACLDGADVVHMHVPWDFVCCRVAGVANRLGVPYVVALHGMLDDWCMEQRGWKKRLYLSIAGRRLLERAAAVHCTCRIEADQASRWYPRGRSEVIPLIFNPSAFKELPGPELARRAYASALGDDGEPVVLFLSRLHPKKRLDILIDAMARLREIGPPCRLVIAGTGEPEYEQSMRDLVTRHDLGDRVEFVGFVSGQEKISLYQACDLFVLPTDQDTWPFALIEPLACGLPLVTTRGVDIWQDLESSGGAVIVETTPANLAETIKDLIDDPDKCRDMGRRGRQWVLECLDPDRIMDRYEALYRELGGGSAAGTVNA